MCQINTEPMISQAGYLDVLGKRLHVFINNENNVTTKLNSIASETWMHGECTPCFDKRIIVYVGNIMLS